MDNVNQPAHYTFGKYECIEVMQDVFGAEALQTFCKLNAFKYLWRSQHKNGDEDIRKATWYLNKYLEMSDVIAKEQCELNNKEIDFDKESESNE